MREGGLTWNRVVIGLAVMSSGLAMAACGATRTHSEPMSVSQANDEPRSDVGLSACLARQGIAGTEEPAHTEPSSDVGGVLGQGGMRVPVGVARSHFEAALKKCGVGKIQVQGAPITNSTFRRQIVRLAICLRHSGFEIPPPNMSGTGPVFDTRRIDTASARWRTSKRACRLGSE
jgi:hypothetical protein